MIPTTILDIRGLVVPRDGTLILERTRQRRPDLLPPDVS